MVPLFRKGRVIRCHRLFHLDLQRRKVQPHHLVQVILGRRMLRLLRLDPVIQMDPLPRLRREVLDFLKVQQFPKDLLFHLGRGHHLYRANLDFHYLPLFRRDLLLLTDLRHRWVRGPH